MGPLRHSSKHIGKRPGKRWIKLDRCDWTASILAALVGYGQMIRFFCDAASSDGDLQSHVQRGCYEPTNHYYGGAEWSAQSQN